MYFYNVKMIITSSVDSKCLRVFCSPPLITPPSPRKRWNKLSPLKSSATLEADPPPPPPPTFSSGLPLTDYH